MTDYLSADQAVEQLIAADSAPIEAAPAPEPVAPAEAAAPEVVDIPSEPATTGEDAPAPAEPASEGAEAVTPEPVKPAVEAPHFWSAEKKARFAEIPPDLQSVILEEGENGNRRVNKSLEDSANARRAADEARTKAEAEATRLTDLAKRLGDILPRAEEAHRSRWAGVTQADWVKLATDNPDGYVQAKALYEAETADLQRLKDAKADTDRIAKEETDKRAETDRAAYAEREAGFLRRYAPELADPKTGPELQTKLVAYLQNSLGVTKEELPLVSGRQLAAGLKAMRYDEAQAAATAPKPKAAPAAPAPSTRPGNAGAQPPRTAAATAMASLSRSGRPEDAVAALLSMQG